MTLGHVGLIGLLYQASPLSAAMRNLGAVGQMALTNYLTQSLICMLLFTGAGLALYGQLERHELYYVVAAIWIVQLIWSPLWLRRFRFGPAEWLWRSLTYWQRQPMRSRSGERHSCLRRKYLPDRLHRVRLFDALVVAIALHAREAQRESARIARARLQIAERDLDDELRSHVHGPADRG